MDFPASIAAVPVTISVPDGFQGPPGPQGVPGPQGPAGAGLVSPSGLPLVVPEVRVMLAAEQAPITVIAPGGAYTELTPVTGNTTQFYSGNPGWAYPELAYAYWRLLVSVPKQNALIARLCTADNGPSNLNPIAYIGGSTYHWSELGSGTVANEAVDITAAMQAALNSKTAPWQLYWQFSGDNSDPVSFYASRIELGWKLG